MARAGRSRRGPLGRRKSDRKSASAWSGEIESELLAWAEHCRKKDGTGGHFEQTIVRHLERVIGRTFSYAQIQGKIKEIAGRPDTGTPLCHIHYTYVYKTYDAGGMLHCIIKDRAALKVLRQRVQELDKNESSKPAKYNTPARDDKRQLFAELSRGNTNRSALRGQDPASTKIVDKKRLLPGGPKVAKTQYRKLRAVSEVPQTPSFSYGDAISTLTSPRPPMRDGSVSSLSSTSETLGSNRSQETYPLVQDDRDRPHFQHDPNHVQKPTGSHGSAGPLIHDQHAPPMQRPCTDAVLQDRVLALQQDNAYLRQQLREEQESNAQLERKILSKENAETVLAQRGVETIRDTIARYEQEIEIQKARANEKAAVGIFTKDANKKFNTCDFQYLKDHMRTMHYHLENVMLEFCDQAVTTHQLFSHENDELQKLCTRIFSDCNNAQEQIGCSYLLRSLVSAAICEWVFERKYQEECIASTLLMELMLSSLTTLYGEDATQALHFAANDSLIRSAYFQEEVIPRSAIKLADDLHLLLDSASSTWCPDGLSTSEARKQWQKEKRRLRQVFVEALRIKTYTFVSNHIFEAVFPASRTEVVSETVEIEEQATTRRYKPPETKTCIVELSLAPGLRNCAFKRTLVDYNSFRRAESNLQGGYDQIVPPSVLVWQP